MSNKSTKGTYLETLLRSQQTIFSIQDVALLWGEEDEKKISLRLNKYVRKGALIKVRRGLYAKDTVFDYLELATRIYTPAYISFETILTRTGINFQFYGNIFVASYINREIIVGEQKITFVRTKDYVLSSTTGIDHSLGYAIATPERAFLDRVYVSKEYHFDNLTNLNWDKVFEYVPMYHNKRLEKKVRTYYKSYQDSIH